MRPPTGASGGGEEIRPARVAAPNGHISRPRGRLAPWALGAVAAAALLALTRVRLPIRLIDFEHYYRAGHLLWAGQNPYGQIEFFAPPWLALLLAPLLPLPLETASVLWLLLTVACMSAMGILSLRWLRFPRSPRWRLASVVLATLAPAALFVYITGQVTAVVGVCALAAAYALSIAGRGKASPLAVIGLLIASLKPHVVAVPVLLSLFALIRGRQWRLLGALSAGGLLLAVAGFVMLPAWPAALWSAWRSGDFLGGPGLVAAGFRGLPDLGIPIWVFVPVGAYTLWRFWRAGLTAGVTALAFGVTLLLVPYSRSYDHVVLVYPALAAIALARERRRWAAAALVGAGVLVPFAGLAVLTPVLIVIALLIGAGEPGMPRTRGSAQRNHSMRKADYSEDPAAEVGAR